LDARAATKPNGQFFADLRNRLIVVIRVLAISARRFNAPFAFNSGGSKHDTPFDVSTLAGAIAIAAIGCQRSATNHKLVATGPKHSVPLYADEATYQKASHQPAGVGAETPQVDDQTPVVIISSDDSGAVVEIVDGPMKGQNGFVAKDNVD